MTRVYRRHGCAGLHATYSGLASCMWPHAEWITGEGRYAVVARCRVLTVTLHRTVGAAEEAKIAIDRRGCGGECRRQHEVIRLWRDTPNPRMRRSELQQSLAP